MSDAEEEITFCRYGTNLDPYNEDEFPKRKPVPVEDQIATDAQGRRRFHGAFTGGFSAGFYNTVGSLEGWTPSEFRSTRADKAKDTRTQRPEDFMDEEDRSEFGIAPQTVKATKDFSTVSRKRKHVGQSAIPGDSVLKDILTSGNETIGYYLLKNMSAKGRRSESEVMGRSEGRVYGCEMPRVPIDDSYEVQRHDLSNQYKIQDIYKEFLQSPKSNTQGLGYSGLDKSHVNLFQQSDLVIMDPSVISHNNRGGNKKQQRNRKLHISGQAFGVGAFEDDDEDIYVKDDMSRYDFEMTSEKVAPVNKKSKDETILDDFVASTASRILTTPEIFAPPTIPHSFTGKHKTRKSRFEPESPAADDRDRDAPTPRLNPDVRARYLGEETVESSDGRSKPTVNVKSDDRTRELLSQGLLFDRFVTASRPEDPSNILEAVQKSETTHGSEETRNAVKMKMFGPLTRVSEDWQPCTMLCRRFNVPEPRLELDPRKQRKRTKNLIFEYEKNVDLTADDLKPGLSQPIFTEGDNVQFRPVETSGPTVTADAPLSGSTVTTDATIPPELGGSTVDTVVDIERNTDLFKAIFLDSSSSDEDEDKGDDKDSATGTATEEMKQSVLSDTLLPKIQPFKEGILSNMDFSVFEPDKSVSEPPLNDSYGPQLPKLPPSSSLKVVVSKSSDDDDEWVEMGSEVGLKERGSKTKRTKDRKKKKHVDKKKKKKKRKHKHDRD